MTLHPPPCSLLASPSRPLHFVPIPSYLPPLSLLLYTPLPPPLQTLSLLPLNAMFSTLVTSSPYCINRCMSVTTMKPRGTSVVPLLLRCGIVYHLSTTLVLAWSHSVHLHCPCPSSWGKGQCIILGVCRRKGISKQKLI